MATNASFAGPLAGSILTPSASKMTTLGSYLDIQNDGWAKQYLPELYESEVQRYGNRTISGFLSQISAEMPMSSDQVIWSEQGRLHLSYNGEINPVTGAIDAITGIDSGASETHAIRKGATLVCEVNSIVFKAFVKVGVEIANNALTIKPYGSANVDDLAGIAVDDNQAIKFFVYGSEFKKADTGMNEAVKPSFQSYTNNPIILKDKYEISGSDASQIGWVEVTGEAGQSGYLWYIKAEGDTRKRFEDYLEMAMIESEKNVNTNLADIAGTEGLFAAVKDRGHIHEDGIDGSSASDDLADFDNMLKKLDKQGAIEENVLFLNRDLSLNIDDMLAAQNSYGSGGTSWGLFNNSEDMAINLGFSGFRRGSYDFYKTDWKYLNDASTRGEIASDVTGILVPAGTSSVYDQILGKNIKRPFLHVRYRASQSDDRKLKSWITGSVGGASTSDLDAMEVHYLSERCLVVQAANNFVLFGNFA